MSAGDVGAMSALRRRPGSMGVLTGSQLENPYRSRISKAYWCCEIDRQRLEQSRSILTPSSQEVGPRSRNLKCLRRSSLTRWMPALSLPAMVISSTKTGMMRRTPSVEVGALAPADLIAPSPHWDHTYYTWLEVGHYWQVTIDEEQRLK